MRSYSVGDARVSGSKVAAMMTGESESAPVPEVPLQMCDFCQSTCEYNRNGEYEALLFCKDCNAKGKAVFFI